MHIVHKRAPQHTYLLFEPLLPALIDDLNDLQVTGQHLGQHLDGPLLQGFRHDRVVGVVQALHCRDPHNQWCVTLLSVQ